LIADEYRNRNLIFCHFPLAAGAAIFHQGDMPAGEGARSTASARSIIRSVNFNGEPNAKGKPRP